MDKELKKLLKRWLMLFGGCVVIGVICNYPILAALIFGFGWCVYVINKDNKGV